MSLDDLIVKFVFFIGIYVELVILRYLIYYIGGLVDYMELVYVENIEFIDILIVE